MTMQTFKIIPILGLKTDVAINDPSLFSFVSDTGNVALTHDTGGQNMTYSRKRNACTKEYGYTQWSNSANAQATKCLGLFELVSGSTVDHIYFDNGKMFVFDASNNPAVIEDGSSTTFANDNQDIYSIIQVGEYLVFSDRAEHTPYKWKNGDANLTKLIASGTEYNFRYLESFQRRVIGAYSTETNGDIEIRWSTDWPVTAITSLNFPAANQAYIPNDDRITGIRRMGLDRCFVYCDDSIHAIDYLQDYKIPFRLRNVNSKQGCEGHHSVINLGDRHFLFNRNYGFCEFRGDTFPYGSPISEAIEPTVQNIHSLYMDRIVGTYVPLSRELCWAVPLDGVVIPNALLYYNIDTGVWRKRDVSARYVAHWRVYLDYTWTDFITDIGGTGIWSDAGGAYWGDYVQQRSRLVHGLEDGHLYTTASEAYNTGNIDGYRIEPAMDFGDPGRQDLLEEIWFAIGASGAFLIDVYHRTANTIGELEVTSWTQLDSMSCNNPALPRVTCHKLGRYHQIKWGTDLKDEKCEVTSITFKFIPQGDF